MAKSDIEKKQIIADYVECQNYSEVARRHNMSDNGVRAIIEKDEELSKKLEQKNKENTQEVLEAMRERSQTKIKLLDKIFEAMDGKLENIDMFTNIKDLATAYGIIMDKELKLKELEIKAEEIKANKPDENAMKQARELIVSIRKTAENDN